MSTLPVRLGVIGWPIEHSLSPPMQRAALLALGLPFDYAAFAVPPGADLAQALAGARELGLIGLNVTMPYKEAALPLCRPDALARRAAAVNTLRFGADRAIAGTNTDVYGFRRLCEESGVPLRPGLRALLLGAGGAARAACVALLDAGAVPALFGRKGGVLDVAGQALPVRPLDALALAPELSGCDLLVDCTPRGLGARPLGESHPELDLGVLPPQALVLDLVVRPETALTAAARARGLRAAAGAAMLLHQGARALEFWLDRPDRPLPEAVLRAMRAALCGAGASAIIPA